MSEERQVEGPVREPDANGPANRGTQSIQEVQEVVAGYFRSGPGHHPVFDKFEPQHVTQFLKNTSESDKSKQQFRSSNRWFRLFYVMLGIGVFGSLTLLLMPDQSELYFQLLQGLGLFGGGFAGGYGLKSHQDQRSE